MTIVDTSLSSLPPIETARLRMRPCHIGDIEPFRAMTNDPAVTSAVQFLSYPFTATDAERLIVGRGDGRDCFWGVWPINGAAMIGTVGTHLRGSDEIEIGDWCAPGMRGGGLGGEAVAAVIGALIAAYPDRRIFAECRPENTASWRLLEKVGFRAEGVDGVRPARKRLLLASG